MPSTCITEERIVGTAADDVFCCFLFDRQNKTLRVIDFKTKKFQAKQKYLERVFKMEGLRKIFTIVERSEVGGWKSIGFCREGSIPAYYNQSDAYVMSRYCDGDDAPENDEDSSELEGILLKIKGLTKKAVKRNSSIETTQIDEFEAIKTIKEELKRLKDKTGKKAHRASVSKLSVGSPIFSQFSRETENIYFAVENHRTKQVNILGAECQEYYRNAKVDAFFTPVTTADVNLTRSGLEASFEILNEKNITSVFSLVPENEPRLSALYLGTGFNNTGRLLDHRLHNSGPQNILLWAKRLDRPSKAAQESKTNPTVPKS